MRIVEAWGGVCAYCGSARALQKDCVLPLSRGGRYTRDNVVPACRSCNASKRNDEVTAWMRRKGLDERAFLLKLAHASAGVEPGAAAAQPGAGGAETGAGDGEKGT